MNIDILRTQIDEIDSQLIEILARRKQIVTEIGAWKKQQGLHSRDDKRFQEVMQDRIARGALKGIPQEVISKIWHTIHEWAVSVEDNSV